MTSDLLKALKLILQTRGVRKHKTPSVLLPFLPTSFSLSFLSLQFFRSFFPLFFLSFREPSDALWHNETVKGSPASTGSPRPKCGCGGGNGRGRWGKKKKKKEEGAGVKAVK